MKVLTQGHKYELNQFEAIPQLKPLKGLAFESYQVSQLIEKLDPSGAQTAAVMASSALTQKLLDREYGNQTLQFIEKMPVVDMRLGGIMPPDHLLGPDKLDELVTVNNGTTNEEVLEMLIDRMKYLQAKFPCKENACCITHLEEGLMWLEKRTKDRVKRGVEGKHTA
jgi:hypothetical protein